MIITSNTNEQIKNLIHLKDKSKARKTSGTFIVEGIMIGLLGAILPLILLAIIYHQLISWLTNKFSILSDWMVFMSLRTELSVLVPISLILGVGIGLLGSGLTVKRHLKV